MVSPLYHFPNVILICILLDCAKGVDLSFLCYLHDNTMIIVVKNRGLMCFTSLNYYKYVPRVYGCATIEASRSPTKALVILT